jgi:hypothetical protein
VFHAVEAYIFEQTGKVAKTHRGVRSEFARLAKDEPRIGRDFVTFLATAYQFKTQADDALPSSSLTHRIKRRRSRSIREGLPTSRTEASSLPLPIVLSIT